MFKSKKLKKDQLYCMWFSSGYREYFAYGDNLEIMANNLLQKYNWFCVYDKVKDLSEMANVVAFKEDYNFNVYIVEINAAFDDEYGASENGIYLGDYLEYVRSKTETSKTKTNKTETKENDMVNKVHKIITNGDSICFVINTDGDSDFWWWEISRGTWNNYWKDKNPACLIGNIMEWAANEFVNSDECSDCGCSCSSFETVEDASFDYMEN